MNKRKNVILRREKVAAATMTVITLAVTSFAIVGVVKNREVSETRETATTTMTATVAIPTNEITAETTTANTTIIPLTTTATRTPTEVRKLLPENDYFSYKEGKVITTSIAVKNSAKEIVDYIKEGQMFFYLEDGRYDGMLHIYYEKGSTIYDGWIPEITDWISIELI